MVELWHASTLGFGRALPAALALQRFATSSDATQAISSGRAGHGVVAGASPAPRHTVELGRGRARAPAAGADLARRCESVCAAGRRYIGEECDERHHIGQQGDRRHRHRAAGVGGGAILATWSPPATRPTANGASSPTARSPRRSTRSRWDWCRWGSRSATGSASCPTPGSSGPWPATGSRRPARSWCRCIRPTPPGSAPGCWGTPAPGRCSARTPTSEPRSSRCATSCRSCEHDRRDRARRGRDLTRRAARARARRWTARVLTERREAVAPEDAFEIIYTSGTTGPPRASSSAIATPCRCARWSRSCISCSPARDLPVPARWPTPSR